MDLSVDRASDIPVGAQLAAKLRAWIRHGGLGPGDRLPSLREAAVAAGVNLNTVRAVYARLEREGLVRTEQGRGTFVCAARESPDSEAAARRRLRAQIAELEGELAQRPVQPSEAEPRPRASSGGASMLSAQQLAGVRDDLVARLAELDAARFEVLQKLRELPESERQPATRGGGRSSLSLSGARVRWSSP